MAGGGAYAVSAARLLGITRQDRAKMDVWVTSKHRQVPSLEWSKVTDRQSPIPGIGKPPDVSLRPGLEPHAPRSHIPTIDFKSTKSRDDGQPPHNVGFQHSRGHFDRDWDYLSTHVRSSRCGVYMGKSEPASRGRKKPKEGSPQSEEPKSRRRGRFAEEEARKGDEEEAAKLERQQSKDKQRIHVVYDFDCTMDKVYDRVSNRGRGKGLDMNRMSGREQFDQKAKNELVYNYSPSHAASSRHRRCIGGDFSKGPARKHVVRPGSRTYDPKWHSVDRGVMVRRFDKMIVRERAQTPTADQYGGPHELLRPLQSKWSGVTEKLRGWHDRSYRCVLSSPATIAAPRARGQDVISAIRGADASLEMVRGEIGTHRTERVRKRHERSELYRDDKLERLSGRDPAMSPGFRYAYCDTPPQSPSSSPQPRAVSAPVGASGL
eukprot:TRINITY_DN2376_c1_g1_i1.p1 TRINITY_DN2376_c1_g1~~TRINITY_DN2376_c1_g1_i1.p1  ORF type:complete len:459 (+),score=128.54 TRINITY_DN2376_c1_g1_i1:77-1378(+)